MATKRRTVPGQMDSQSLNELQLMCNVLIEDSEWLDSFQSETLRNVDEKACRISIISDDGGEDQSLDANQLPMRGDQRSGVTTQSLISKECCGQHLAANKMSSLSLPAPEYISGSKSCVTSESMRLLHTVANEIYPRAYSVKQTTFFKKSLRSVPRDRS